MCWDEGWVGGEGERRRVGRERKEEEEEGE